MKLKNCSFADFIKKIDNKTVVCMGAGVMFLDMLNIYEELGMPNKVKFIVDNNPNLWNKQIVWKDHSYIVYPVTELLKYSSNDIVVIITGQQFGEMLERLDNFKELENVECYIFTLMRGFRESSVIPQIECKEQKIPKKIHYCWFGGNKLPEIALKCIESFRKFCPDYEIIEWNETNYDVNKLRYMREAYESKKYAFVSDYARLDVVYQHGGICFDVDVEILKNLDPLLCHDAFCGFTYYGTRVSTGSGFGAVKGFHIIKDWMDAYNNEVFITETGAFNQKLCPFYQTEVLKSKNLNENGKYQVIEGLVCYPREFFDPISGLTQIDISTEDTYSIHHTMLSWSDNKVGSFFDIREKGRFSTKELLKRIESGG